ncbi:MAG: hypothetical protein NC321_06095 [Clostridium sp.]|nr:hypothetical protein [Clostridium sp.]
MKEINYWDRFLMTGSVSDFLSYRNALQDVKSGEVRNDTEKDKSGGLRDAGVYRDYGDGSKSGTHW